METRMKLQDELQALRDNVMQSIPAETTYILAGSMKEIEQSGISDRVLKTGDTAPAFSLPDVHGNMISSQELLEQGPLVISFYRGGW